MLLIFGVLSRKKKEQMLVPTLGRYVFACGVGSVCGISELYSRLVIKRKQNLLLPAPVCTFMGRLQTAITDYLRVIHTVKNQL